MRTPFKVRRKKRMDPTPTSPSESHTMRSDRDRFLVQGGRKPAQLRGTTPELSVEEKVALMSLQGVLVEMVALSQG